MTGIVSGCIVISGVLGSIFTPDLVTGFYHEHHPMAAYMGWIFDVIALWMLWRVASSEGHPTWAVALERLTSA